MNSLHATPYKTYSQEKQPRYERGVFFSVGF